MKISLGTFVVPKTKLEIGTINYYGNNKTLTLEFSLTKGSRDKTNFKTLESLKTEYYMFSMVGNIGRECCGQILDKIKEHIKNNELKFKNDNVRNIAFELFDLWEKYHLNDLKAGTFVQEQLVKGSKSYEESVEKLKKHDLHIDRGYQYGTEWLLEVIPSDVISRIEKLITEIK